MLLKDNNIFDGKSYSEIERLVYHQINFVTAQHVEISKTDENFKPTVIDYSEDLLSLAQKYKKRESTGLSALFFSTYFEHKINDIVFKLLRNRNKESSTLTRVLRFSIEDKCTWILDLINVDRIAEEHLKTIKKIYELRNSFLHYKWEAAPEKFDTTLLVSAGKVVLYLKHYEEKVLFDSKRKKLSKYLDAERAFKNYVEFIKTNDAEAAEYEQLQKALLDKLDELNSTLSLNKK